MKLLLTNSNLQLYKYLAKLSDKTDMPVVLTYRELAKILKLSPGHILKVVRFLRKNNFISTCRVGLTGKSQFTIL